MKSVTPCIDMHCLPCSQAVLPSTGIVAYTYYMPGFPAVKKYNGSRHLSFGNRMICEKYPSDKKASSRNRKDAHLLSMATGLPSQNGEMCDGKMVQDRSVFLISEDLNVLQQRRRLPGNQPTGCREGFECKAQKKGKPDGYFPYARVCLFCSNEAIGLSRQPDQSTLWAARNMDFEKESKNC